MVKGKRFVLKRHFDGMPKREDFDLVEEELPELKDGEVTIEAIFLSVDPYMRPYTARHTPPYTMIGANVSKILASKNDRFKPGDTVITNAGWIKVGNVNANDPAKAVTKAFDLKVNIKLSVVNVQ